MDSPMMAALIASMMYIVGAWLFRENRKDREGLEVIKTMHDQLQWFNNQQQARHQEFLKQITKPVEGRQVTIPLEYVVKAMGELEPATIRFENCIFETWPKPLPEPAPQPVAPVTPEEWHSNPMRPTILEILKAQEMSGAPDTVPPPPKPGKLPPSAPADQTPFSEPVRLIHCGCTDMLPCDRHAYPYGKA